MGPYPGLSALSVQKKQLQSSKPVSAAAHCTQSVVLAQAPVYQLMEGWDSQMCSGHQLVLLILVLILWEGWRKTSVLPCWVALNSQTGCYDRLLICCVIFV